MNKCAYIFLDEAGNLDFSPSGSRTFVLTSVSMRRPFPSFDALDAYKHDCLEYGLNTEYFHCAYDNALCANDDETITPREFNVEGIGKSSSWSCPTKCLPPPAPDLRKAEGRR